VKRCNRCGKEKELDQFHRDGSKSKGVSNWCKKCELEHFNQVSLTAIRQWKEETPCADCGEFFPHYVMEFDHLNGDIRPRKHRGSFLARVRTVEACVALMERESVELVCANCHKIRTWERAH
jgi:hypothetical protein